MYRTEKCHILVYKVEMEAVFYLHKDYLEKNEKNGHELDVSSIKVRFDQFFCC